MVLFSSRISPFTSTVIFFDRSPLATAVVTSAMLRTWPVRFAAMAFTLSVRPFQVPAAPGTCAWPPSLEGPHRQCDRHGGEPHRPGAQHRGGDHGGCQGRPVEEDHGGREGRDPR